MRFSTVFAVLLSAVGLATAAPAAADRAIYQISDLRIISGAKKPETTWRFDIKVTSSIPEQRISDGFCEVVIPLGELQDMTIATCIGEGQLYFTFEQTNDGTAWNLVPQHIWGSGNAYWLDIVQKKLPKTDFKTTGTGQNKRVVYNGPKAFNLTAPKIENPPQLPQGVKLVETDGAKRLQAA